MTLHIPVKNAPPMLLSEGQAAVRAALETLLRPAYTVEAMEAQDRAIHDLRRFEWHLTEALNGGGE